VAGVIGLLGAVGDFLPLAAAVSLSPFPIVATTLVLARADGVAAGAALSAGWSASLATVTLLLTFAVGELDFEVGAYVQIVVGLLLVAAGVAKWRGRTRGDDEPQVPGWMRALREGPPGRIVLYGLALGANPKNLALAAAAASSISTRGLGGATAFLAAAIFVALGSLFVIGAVAARALGGSGTLARLESVRVFMLRHNGVIMMVVLLFLGLKVLGDGLADIGS